ncbi:monocarboxylate transporter 5-like isoform X2 [Mizuhopecten yessoensis]|uniref:monocarboxylate transporter 5-like isoform X2 n=1 Tax=Mizuhopecten yessoensis TaxID=6573 RepID=UPI000B45EAB7|nr:monocarboxylate transporter 5-like isoform X2 [Mizuhopecten yessoensis]
MADLNTDSEGRHPRMSIESGSSPKGTAHPDGNTGSDHISDVKLVDGGYGWVIVGASFFNLFCLDGLIGIYGLLYPELLINFGAEPAVTALPGSLMVGMCCFIGPVCSELIRRFGARQVTVFGACVTCVGLLCSFASQSMTVFLFTHGILTGIGCGLYFLPSMTLVNTYFDRKRGIAQGIISAGSGLGVVVLSPVTNILMDYYGWKASILLWAGFVLNICVSGLLMRPPPQSTKGGNHRCAGTIKLDREAHDESSISYKQHEDHLWSSLSLQENREIQNSNVKNGKVQNGRVPNRFVYVGNTEHSSTRSLPHRHIDRHDVSKEQLGLYRSLQCVHQPKHKRHKHLPANKRSIFDRKDIFLTGSTNILRTYSSHRSVHSKHVEEMEHTYATSDDTSSYMTSDSGGSLWCKGTCKPFMKDPAFLLLVAGSALAQMAQHIPMTFLADYSYFIGLEGRDIATLFVIFGVFNMAGRLAGGLLASIRMFSPLFVCNFGNAVCALACFLFWLCTTFESLAVFIGVYAFFVGGLYQLTQNYIYSNVFGGCLLLLTAIIMSVMPFVAKYRLQKQEAPDIEITPRSLDVTDTTSGERGSRGKNP